MSKGRSGALAGFGAVLAGALVLTIGLAAIRSESELRVASARAELQQKLAEIGVRLEKEIAAAADVLRDAALRQDVAQRDNDPSEGDWPHALWRADGRGFELLSGPPEARTLYAPFAAIGARFGMLGPVTSADGGDVLILQSSGAGGERFGAAVRLDDLWSRSGVLELAGEGTSITVEDERGVRIYRSSPAVLREPVASTLLVGGLKWRLAAAPSAGWGSAVDLWTSLVPVWLVAAAYMLAFLLLARRPAALREEVAELIARLRDKDAELSAVLRSRSELEARLATSRSIDAATGLPNRRSLVDQLRLLLSQTRLTASSPVLAGVLRFRHLDEIGPSMGSTFAEGLLSRAGDRLLGSLGRDTYVARSGESELAFCLRASGIDPESVATQLLGELERPFDIEGRLLFARVLVGIAVSADGYAHAPELLNDARLAVAEAAQQGRSWAVFRPEAKAERLSMLQLEADLHDAVRNGSFKLYVQPIVSIADGGLVGFESLLRWQHPTGAWIEPEYFIALAQDIGQMPRITDWLARACIAHGARVEASGLYLSLNLTPADLNRELCDRLFELLAEARVSPERLRLEITETTVVRDFRLAARLIKELNERGTRVVLDDFGTGYSSLSYLRELPFHAVKIDKSFVQGMSYNVRDFGMVKSIVSLVHYLGMECVAEGVETEELLELVELAGCDYWQGHLFSPPVPAERIGELVAIPAARRAGPAPGAA